MRNSPSVLHVDLDAFFASVEQRDKPSLRGKPVIVGGIGPRGVVATASYEAREYGVRSAMRTAEARARCPHGAYLAGRFHAYRAASGIVMRRLTATAPVVQPLSLDEAFVDLASNENFDASRVQDVAESLAADIRELTGGLTASIGVGSSKLMAKIASELDKPDGIFIVPSGSELDLIGPMHITVIPGVGPATTERLRRIGVRTVADARAIGHDELVRILGQAAGLNVYRLAHAQDDRPVVVEREAKSISVEDTFSIDVTDRDDLAASADRMARKVAGRLHKNGASGRTVTLKIRHHDFTTHTRSQTLSGPTDNPDVISDIARRLLSQTELHGGLRLLGVGVSGLTDWVQDDLFGDKPAAPAPPQPVARTESWIPGMDVRHDHHGDGWVWGSGLGRVTIRFETRHTPPGPVLTFDVNDPALTRPEPDEITGA